MSRQIKSILAIATLLLLTACAGGVPRQIIEVEPTARITRPSPGKSLVYFVRTTIYAGAVPSPLFDGDKYIGTIAMEYDATRGVKKKNHLAYETEPGKHVFMTYSEIGDFLPAELLPGKTYYVQVRPVIGTWAARFYLTPQNGQLNQPEIDEIIANGGQLRVTDEGLQWARDKAADIQKFKAEQWEKWQARPASSRHELRKESGR